MKTEREIYEFMREDFNRILKDDILNCSFIVDFHNYGRFQ